MRRWPATILVAALTAGCAGSGAVPPPPGGNPVPVVASLFPLAEMVRRVGLGRVSVTELSSSGAEPGADLDRARVVFVVGRGFQPDFERAAEARRAEVIPLWDVVGGADPHFWLDPVAMQLATDLVVAALIRADPAGRAAYQVAARSFKAQLGALDIDYRSSLAGCLRRDLVTAGGGFTRLAARYGLISHAATDPGVLPLIRAHQVRTVFTEPPLPPGPAEALARAAGIRTVPLATIAIRTPGEAARGETYVALMTDNLAKLRTALACSES